MMYDVIIIGAGPAGYVAAIRAGQLGMKTALIEKKQLGGMCLNWGCIPTKAMIESAKMFDKMKQATVFGIDGFEPAKLSFNWDKARKRAQKIAVKLKAGVGFLLKKNRVELITGEAIIKSAQSIRVDNRTLEGKHIIIATGSYPLPLPTQSMPEILQLDKLFEQESLPHNLVVSGKGPVAVEITLMLHLIGKNLTLIIPDEDVVPGADTFISEYILKHFKALKIPVIISDNTGVYAEGQLSINGTQVACDMLINSNQRKAIVPASEVEIALNGNGFIATNEAFETSVAGIYAVGDVNGHSYLAHPASAQGIFVVNRIKGIQTHFNFDNYPLNIYTYPEIAQIGKTEQQLKSDGTDYKVSPFPLSANGKALTEGQSEGLIRLLSDTKYGQVLGVQIIADHATDMIAEAAAYMQIEGTVYDVAATMHAHPTVSEIFMEAGFEATDKAIHL